MSYKHTRDNICPSRGDLLQNQRNFFTNRSGNRRERMFNKSLANSLRPLQLWVYFGPVLPRPKKNMIASLAFYNFLVISYFPSSHRAGIEASRPSFPLQGWMKRTSSKTCWLTPTAQLPPSWLTSLSAVF